MKLLCLIAHRWRYTNPFTTKDDKRRCLRCGLTQTTPRHLPYDDWETDK